MPIPSINHHVRQHVHLKERRRHSRLYERWRQLWRLLSNAEIEAFQRALVKGHDQSLLLCDPAWRLRHLTVEEEQALKQVERLAEASGLRLWTR